MSGTMVGHVLGQEDANDRTEQSPHGPNSRVEAVMKAAPYGGKNKARHDETEHDRQAHLIHPRRDPTDHADTTMRGRHRGSFAASFEDPLHHLPEKQAHLFGFRSRQSPVGAFHRIEEVDAEARVKGESKGRGRPVEILAWTPVVNKKDHPNDECVEGEIAEVKILPK